MPIPDRKWRRQHKKSRKGCQTCKLRKVKCDEQHPACGNCLRLSHPCSFQDVPSDAPRSLTVSPCPSLSPARSDASQNSRILDLRLLHHFATSVCYQFPETEDPKVLDLWAIAVPQMSFTNEFLLDAILSASALHLSTITNDETMATVSHQYFGRAVIKHRNSLGDITRFTADPLCLSSVLIMALTFKLSSQQAVGRKSAAPVEWFRIIDGMRRLISLSEPFLGNGGMHLLLQKGLNLDPEIGSRTLEELQQLQHMKLLVLPEGLDNEDIDSASRASRQRFRDKLGQILLEAIAGDDKAKLRRRLLGLAATREELFLQLAEQEDPMTMILLSQFFALFKWTGGNWWLQSSLDLELDRLMQCIPVEYRWTVESGEIGVSSMPSLFT